jgi:hypothetical protein
MFPYAGGTILYVNKAHLWIGYMTSWLEKAKTLIGLHGQEEEGINISN